MNLCCKQKSVSYCLAIDNHEKDPKLSFRKVLSIYLSVFKPTQHKIKREKELKILRS